MVIDENTKLPDTWQMKTIQDAIVCDFGDRITQAENRGTLYPVYGGGAISFYTDNSNRNEEWVIGRFAISPTCVRFVHGKFWLMDSGFTFHTVDDSIDYNYAGQYLSAIQPMIYQATTQTAQKNLDQERFQKLPFPVPPLPEQERIASILGNLDDLIEKQEALIEKKQRLREKVSNDLLLGVRRLPEYVDDVQNRTIGSLGYIYGGLSNKTSEDFENGNASFITFVNVLRNTIIDPKQMGTVCISRGENQNAVQYGDLLLNGSSETPEETAMCAVFLEHKDNIYLNSFCFGFRIQDQNINPLYMSYYINIALRDEIALISPGSTRHNLNKDSFKKLEFRCPSKAEQDAIADVLLAMDKEIDDLISSTEKNRRLKSGLLRKLMTGEIRVA